MIQATITGRLGADPEKKTTPNGSPRITVGTPPPGSAAPSGVRSWANLCSRIAAPGPGSVLLGPWRCRAGGTMMRTQPSS